MMKKEQQMKEVNPNTIEENTMMKTTKNPVLFEELLKQHDIYCSETRIRKYLDTVLVGEICDNEKGIAIKASGDAYVYYSKLYENVLQIDALSAEIIPQIVDRHDSIGEKIKDAIFEVSSLLMRALHTERLTGWKTIEDRLQEMSAISCFIHTVAEEEHGNDWDPQWVITLSNGSWKTAPAYWQFIVDDGHILIEAPGADYMDWMTDFRFWEPENFCYRVPIGLIESMEIEFCR